MGGGSSPKPDPNIGLAAIKTAEVGEQMLAWMQDQAAITNEWAEQDRTRWNDVFKPLQDQYVADAQNWATPERRDSRADQAIADTRLQARVADDARVRQAMAMGVNPASGAFQAASAKAGVDSALAASGAGNLARRQVDAEAESKMANAINMGNSMAVNPATSMGLSNGAIQAGGQAAQQGYAQQSSILNAQYQNQSAAWQSNNQNITGLFGAAGSLAGMAMLSSKDAKTDKKPMAEGEALGAMRKMPVEEWRYKEGMGDGGSHIGTYAEDFQRATGKGDGKTINVVDAIGVTMGAIRDLDKKVERLAGGHSKKRAA